MAPLVSHSRVAAAPRCRRRGAACAPRRRAVAALAAASAEGARPGGGAAAALGGQVSVGSVAGFAVGYGAKRVGQLLLVVLGCEIVALQVMARRGWVDVRWDQIVRDISPHVERKGLDRAVHTLKFKVRRARPSSAARRRRLSRPA